MAKKKKAKASKREELIDMIDEQDNVIGTMTRKESKGSNILHRAIFVMVFDADGRLYVQKRSKNKEKFPGLWTVSCCGGVISEESYHDAAERELIEELGIDAPSTFVCKIRYRDEKFNVLGDLYTMMRELPIKFNKKEIEAGKFVTEDEMKKMIMLGSFVPESKALIIKY
jgi:isopentenyl-diphosphate delta-isomerase type 1